MESSREEDADLLARVRQQEVVAELGQRALETDDLDRLLREASVAVAETLDGDYCAIFETSPDGDEALVREGVGWREGLVETVSVPADADSQLGRALDGAGPVIVESLPADERFAGPGLLTDHDVVSGISVLVGSVERPWGVLGVYATDRREFTEHDANFVQSVANVLASAIENERTSSEREEIYGRISDAFCALDEEWRFTHLNERAHEMINPEGRTLVGENIWEVFPEAIGRKFESEYEHAMYEQETVSFEEHYPEPLDAWFEVRAYPSETGLSVYFRDVTERKERERALEQSEQRYRTLAESFPNGLVTLFDEGLRYTLAAGRAFEEMPVSRADLEGRTPREAWGADVAETLEPVLEAALDGEERSVEVAYAGREWLIHAVPVTDDDGEVFAGMTMGQDVTERKWFERTLTALHESSRELLQLETEAAVCESVVQTTTDVLGIPGAGIYLYDEDESELAPVASSEYVEELFGDLQTFGPGDTAITWETFAGRETISFDDVRGTDLAYHDDTPLRSGIWIPLGDHGVLGVVSEEVGAFDSDERKLADLLAATAETALDRVERERQRRRHERELEAQNERLDRFASMLAHELRNPVTIGQIYGQQLSDGTDSEAVEYVTEAFDRIEDMIDVMLVLTRGSDAVGGSSPVDLATAAREAWDDVDAPEATLEVALDRTIRTDETYVRHLFENLFENAVEHGGADVTVTVGELPTGFYVEDDGAGIPPDERETVFEAGYTTAADQGGTGLGLAFVEELAEVYEWDCAVTESAAGGARFEFRNVEFTGVE